MWSTTSTSAKLHTLLLLLLLLLVALYTKYHSALATIKLQQESATRFIQAAKPITTAMYDTYPFDR